MQQLAPLPAQGVLHVHVALHGHLNASADALQIQFDMITAAPDDAELLVSPDYERASYTI